VKRKIHTVGYCDKPAYLSGTEIGTSGQMEILTIQYLRGFAATMVVFHHLGLQLTRLGYSGYWPDFLTSGVDIFFVISGFIMWVTTANGMTSLEFFRRRIIRIVPLYWALTTVTLCVLVLFPRLVQTGRLQIVHVLGSYLFFPVLHPTQGIMYPLLIPGWTLNYEMFFYAIFGGALVLPTGLRLITVSLIICGFAVIPIVTKVPVSTPEAFYTSNIILEFVFGMALGWLYIRGLKLPLSLAWACVLIGAALLIFTGSVFEDRGLLVGVPALLVVAGAIMIERVSGVPRIWSLHLLGNASYSLYLSHTIILSLVEQVWARFPTLGGARETLFVFGCVAVTSAIFVGILIHLNIETRILRMVGRRSRKLVSGRTRR
jgi:exopolysaccharide production protein ExoZ